MIPIPELAIVPFEGTPAPVVRMLADDLVARGIAARIDAPMALPPAAYVPARDQYRAETLLARVSVHAGRHVLGITHRDLYARGLNFVFGIAAPGGACVVSTARLTAGVDGALFRSRLRKEAVHELGHTLGLGHCADPGCVMHFSNSLADTDRKGEAYCERCAASVIEATGRPRRS
jgi:archaemetzincin